MASQMSRVSKVPKAVEHKAVIIDFQLSRVGEVPGKSRVAKV